MREINSRRGMNSITGEDEERERLTGEKRNQFIHVVERLGENENVSGRKVISELM